jgi:hypothetical protein
MQWLGKQIRTSTGYGSVSHVVHVDSVGIPCCSDFQTRPGAHNQLTHTSDMANPPHKKRYSGSKLYLQQIIFNMNA